MIPLSFVQNLQTPKQTATVGPLYTPHTHHIIEHNPVNSLPASTGGSLLSSTPWSAGFRFSWIGSSPGGNGWLGSMKVSVLNSAATGASLGSLGVTAGNGLLMFILILPPMEVVVVPESSSTLPSMELTISARVVSTSVFGVSSRSARLSSEMRQLLMRCFSVEYMCQNHMMQHFCN